MRKLLCAIAILLAPIAAVGLLNHHRSNVTKLSEPDQPAGPSTGKRHVVVELFTSEGCSSCPPADALLSQLQDSQPISGAEIITLSEHVDYWNRLGWKDPYSSSQFTNRQQRYADVLKGEDPYTPQMIVDGQKAFVGSRESEARRAIAAAAEVPAAAVTLSLDNASRKTGGNRIAFTVRVDNIPSTVNDRPLEVLLAVTESGLSSSVKSGENSGRTLTHTSVVRKLISVGTVTRKSAPGFSANPVVEIGKSWQSDRLRAVAFLQDKSTLQILGANLVDLATAKP
jgi:hypothetical protein